MLTKDNIVFLNISRKEIKRVREALNSPAYNYYPMTSLKAITNFAKTTTIHLIIVSENTSPKMLERINLFANSMFISVLILTNSEKKLDNLSSDVNNEEYLMYAIKTLCRASWVANLKNNETNLSINDIYSKTIELIDALDMHTSNHSSSVMDYAIELGRKLDLKPVDMIRLINAALLHDIGKTVIPKQIISSPNKLTKDEYEIIKLHTTLLNHLVPNELADLKDIIRHHHEKYDGTGYPDGLKGQAIPFISRIITVIDSFDAMTSQRLYNIPVSLQRGTEILEKDSGTHFDPMIVKEFIVVLKKKKLI